MDLPQCNLFMLMSLDGKISTGCTDNMDFDKHIPMIVKGIDAYYSAEKETCLWSMISGATAVKLGANERRFISEKHMCNHIVVDSHKLDTSGLEHIADNCQKMVLITDETMPERINIRDNMHIVYKERNYTFRSVMQELYNLGIREITVQTGGKINAKLFREGLVNFVEVFIAPVIVGGRRTPTLVDGESLFNDNHIDLISKLQLCGVSQKPEGFLRLIYKVTNNDRINISKESKNFLNFM